MCPEIYLASLSSAREPASKGGAGPSARGGVALALASFQSIRRGGPRRTGIAAAILKAIEAERELSRQFRNYRGRLGIV